MLNVVNPGVVMVSVMAPRNELSLMLWKEVALSSYPQYYKTFFLLIS